MVRTRFSNSLAIAPLVFAIGACISPASVASGLTVAARAANGALRLEGNDVVISPTGRPVARIDPLGGFTMSGRPVVVTPVQRSELASYHQAVFALVGSSVAVGKTGGAMAGRVIGTVISHLLTGNVQDLQAKTDAGTRVLRRRVAVLCQQVTEMDHYQNAVATTMPAFRPYALVKLDAVEHCRAGETP